MLLMVGSRDHRVRVLLDTGCSIPLVNRKTVEKLGVELQEHDRPLPIENFTGRPWKEQGNITPSPYSYGTDDTSPGKNSRFPRWRKGSTSSSLSGG